MTAISSAYDAIVALCASTLGATATRIPNPYELERTSSLLLIKGFGVFVGPGTNPRTEQSCRIRLNRDFGIVLTRQITATEHDIGTIAPIEKAMFEDQLALIKAFDQNTLNGSVSDVTFTGDGGLELLSTLDASGRFYVLSSVFACTYLQALT